MRSAPALTADGTIIVGNTRGQLLAIEPPGTIRWQFSAGVREFTYPTIAPDGSILALGGYELILGGDSLTISNHLFSVTRAGQKQWELQLSSGPGYLTAPAIGLDGVVYIGADAMLLALDRSGRTRWEFQAGSGIGPPTIGPDGTLYFGSGDNNLYAVNPNGTAKWTFPTAGPVFSAPTIAADGTIYFGSLDRKLYALKPDGTKKWDFEAEWIMEGSPLLDPDGNVYVTSVSSLYVLKGSSPLAPSPWPMFRANVQRTARAFQIGFEQLTQPSPDLLRLSLAIELNISYTIESSTDLQTWSSFTTIQRTNTNPSYIDIQTAGIGQKFFRLKTLNPQIQQESSNR
jgi:outer membrane protein assembly factor BamB